jgi:hypothetical protein
MGKSRRGSKEYTKEQALAKENAQLKRELSHLRKQIARIDLDRYETVSKMCADYQEKERFEENIGEPSNSLEQLKKEWSCHGCGEGWLEITVYSKLGQTWYFRKCNNCRKRTVGKRYDSDSVKGIFHK